MTDRIAAMRARVRIERPERVADDLGGAPLGWSDQGEVWAAIAATGAVRAAEFDANASVSALRVTINRRADVRPGWRVVWGARVLRVVGVRDGGGQRIELFCEEELL